MDYSKSVMAQPITIGNVTVRNRFMVPAVSMEFAEDGQVTDKMLRYFEERARGGYGGSLGNRMRFPLEIIAAIQEKCGCDFPILFRISVEEFAKGGRTTEDTKVIARILEDAGVAAIDLTSSTY